MPSLKPIIALAVLLAGLPVAYADTCSDLSNTTDIQVSYPLDLAYIDEQNEYWSEMCTSLTPTCIIFPTTVDEVSAIIKVLNTNTEQFAIKSGGHNPNNYFSSVEGGPIISTSKLDQVLLDAETGIAQVGPGNRLDGIAEKLDGTGWTFVGGRIGNTGVGGLVLGGGLSYMSTQYGWSASSVLEYEAVLANGTIAHVTNTSDPDLFVALKGGGNNFAVITQYTLQLHPQGDVYGGNLAYLRTEETDAKLLKAVRDFTEYNEDPKAAVIVTAERGNVDLIDAWIIFIFYDGTEVPEGTFANFTAADPVINTVGVRSYANLMATSNWVIVEASTVDIGTETIPLPPAEYGADMMQELHAHWRAVSDTTLLVPGIVASIAWQPFQKAIAQQARARGADLIDADDAAHRLIIEMNYSFLPLASYAAMGDTLEATYSGIRDRVLAWQADGKMPDVYLPTFMNYGFYRQDYWARLRPESRALAQRVSAAVDPDGFFRNRTGGWKP
ncbi:hypothetical protein F4778DRAFT_615644 [Xylariomycetidae sp. FL2044]|nr:hypothetical protein F4778DRAFT_615644 [Xylariomycetidae sp. FL2044]